MTTYHAVIGANYGDEGKGLVTDWLASRGTAGGPHVIVVRYNGGAQAGHTVVTPDGARHVFHHFGSGTLAGADTFLSRYFLVNPMEYVAERGVLHGQLARLPQVYVDPQAYVTTPWDMMVNRAVERKRGGARHGSCGMGINETARRSTHDRWRLTVADLRITHNDGIIVAYRAELMEQLNRIVYEWLPQRMGELGLVPDDLEQVDHRALRSRWMADVQEFMTTTHMAKYQWRSRYDHVVFEGAQGLRLDELADGYPYVTASRTGLTNVVTLLDDADVGFQYDALNVWYVTRPYITRHGPGPLSHEGDLGYAIVDKTNVPNEWQGTLRFAEFDFHEFVAAVKRDLQELKRFPDRAGYATHLVVTGVDQTPEVAMHIHDKREVYEPERFAQRLRRAISAEDVHVSRGPTRADVARVASWRDQEVV